MKLKLGILLVPVLGCLSITSSASSACVWSDSSSSLNVTWPAVDGAVLYDLQLKLSTSSEYSISITSTAPSTQVADLAPNSTYSLKVRATGYDETCGWTNFTPPFACSTGASRLTTTSSATTAPLATACDNCRFMSVVRVSEGIGTEIDFLSNHDSADASGDAGFMTFVGQNSPFIHDFNNSVISQYCIELLDTDLADYVSCNLPDSRRVGGPQHQQPHPKPFPGYPNMTQVCLCNNEIDRRFGHLNITEACGLHSSPMDLCNCSAASTAASAKYVGAMAVYLPWGCGDLRGGDGTCNVSIPFGHWFSTPTEGQCHPDAPVGTNGCTWRRLPRAHTIRGHQLIEAGWNGTDPSTSAMNDTQYYDNADVLSRVFAEITPHPCGLGFTS